MTRFRQATGLRVSVWSSGRFGLGRGFRPAPSPIAPRRIPSGLRRNFAYEIEPGVPPWMAAAEPRQGHPATGPQTMARDRLFGIVRTARKITAIGTEQRRECVAIKFYQQPARDSRQRRKSMQSSRAHIWHPTKIPMARSTKHMAPNTKGTSGRLLDTAIFNSHVPALTRRMRVHFALDPNRKRLLD